MTDRADRWRRALALGAVTGAATLIPLWRIPRGPLLGWTGGVVSVATAAGVALSADQQRREAEVEGTAGPARPLARCIAAPVGVGVVAGAAAAGAMWVNTVTDRWAERGIAALGARRPRLVYAALAAVLTVVAEVPDPPTPKRSAAGARTA